MTADWTVRGTADVESLEIALLLEAVYQAYGYDFRGYSRGSLRRRLVRRMDVEGLKSLSALQECVLHDPACMKRLLLDLSVNVSSMFRDPSFYLAFKTKVVPLLRTYPFVRVWLAGCSTGEEAYSMAIALEEEGLYPRSRIYATEISRAAVASAREGVFALSKVSEYTSNYLRAGGKRYLSDYYTLRDGRISFDPALKRNMVFSEHSLATDGSFNEFQMV